jgi:hypothetical protein
MAAYSSGSVTVRVGSSIIKGNNTNFVTYASIGNIFKIAGENVTYAIAAVNNATRLVLSSRYTNSSEQTSRSENVASCGASTKTYSGTLINRPIIQSYVVVTASERFTDDGAGTLTGGQGGTGSVDYDSGAFTINLNATLTATYNLSASYYSGNTLNSLSYQIVRDYTSNYTLPEAAPSDKNLAYIYTKAMRMIDSQMGKFNSRIASLGG